jgi:hypothetical protein
VDRNETRGPRRSRIALLLLLGGAVAVGAVVAARVPWRGGERAPVVGRTGDALGAAPDATAGPSGESVETALAARAGHPAREIAAALVAECGTDRPDREKINELMTLLLERGDADVLRTAAALLESGTQKAVEVAWCLVFAVLDGDRRTITDDEAYALVGEAATRAFETGSSVVPNPPKLLAGGILARIGTPGAIATLLGVLDIDPAAMQVIAQATNPASVPTLSSALTSGDGGHFVAAALCATEEGRAELRRILDPASGFDWTRHATAKVAAFTALAAGFRKAEDLSAVDAALRQRPELAKLIPDPTRQLVDRYAPPSKSAQARAIVGFLAGHEGSPLEDKLLAMLTGFPVRIVDPLLPRLDNVRRERVVAARSTAK